MIRPILLDFNNLVRSRIGASATEDLSVGGQPTGGIFNSIRSLASLLAANPGLGPVIQCIDDGIPAWKLKAYPSYKKNREELKANRTKEQHDKIYSQLNLTEEAFTMLGCWKSQVKGYEADDVIANLWNLFRNKKIDAVIVSGDHDMRQLIQHGATIYDLNSKIWLNKKNFHEKEPVRPDLFLYYRTLVGDASDNIEGIAGCGEKRAAEFLKAVFGDEERGADPIATMVFYASSLKEPKEFEKNIAEGEAKLRAMAQCADLARAWSDLTVSTTKFYPERSSGLDIAGFKDFCRKLKLNSFLADLQKIVTPLSKAFNVEFNW
jgi:5'-3' exonuclease